MFPGWQPQPMQQAFFQPQFPMVAVQPGTMAPAVSQSQPAPPGVMLVVEGGGPPPPTDGMPPPPGDNPPPLPPEPPPPEETPPEKELKPMDPMEEQKLQNLKNQAAYWQQAKQMQEQAVTAPWGQWQPPGPPPIMAFQPPANPMDAIQREEVEFNLQYAQWKQQYTDWREQNKSHPNRDQFRQYLQQWQMYEAQMEEKKADIHKRKEAIEKQMLQPAQMPTHGLPHGLFPKLPPPQPSNGPPTPENGARFGGPNSRFPVLRPRFDGPGVPRPRFDGPCGPGNRFDVPRVPGPYGGHNLGPRGPMHSTPSHELNPPGTEQGKDDGEQAMQLDEAVEVDTLEELFNSENIPVNKIMLNQLSQHAKQLINEINGLGPEGKQILKSFCTMNPAQLNRMVITLNMLGTEIRAMTEKGLRVTEHTYKRMRRQLLDEMTQLRVKVDTKPPDVSGDGAGSDQGPNPRLGVPHGVPGLMGKQFGPRGGLFAGNRMEGPRFDSKMQYDEEDEGDLIEDGNSEEKFGNTSQHGPPGGSRFPGPRGIRPQFAGPNLGPRFGGPDQRPLFGGPDQRPRFGGADQGPRFGRPDQGPRFGRPDQGPRFGGRDQGPRFGGTRPRGPAPSGGNKGPVSLLSLSFDEAPPGVETQCEEDIAMDDPDSFEDKSNDINPWRSIMASSSMMGSRDPGPGMMNQPRGPRLVGAVPADQHQGRQQGPRSLLGQPRMTVQQPAPTVFQGEVFEPPPEEPKPPVKDLLSSVTSSSSQAPTVTVSSSSSTTTTAVTTTTATLVVQTSQDSKTQTKDDTKVTSDSKNKDTTTDKKTAITQDKNKDNRKTDSKQDEKSVSASKESGKPDTKTDSPSGNDSKAEDTDKPVGASDKKPPTSKADKPTSKPPNARTEPERKNNIDSTQQPGSDKREFDQNRSRRDFTRPPAEQYDRDRQQRGQFGFERGGYNREADRGRGRGGYHRGGDRDRSAHRGDSLQNQRNQDRHRNLGNAKDTAYNENEDYNEEYDANAGYDENAAYAANKGNDKNADHDANTDYNAETYDENAGYGNTEVGYRDKEGYGDDAGYEDDGYGQEDVFGQDEQYRQRGYDEAPGSGHRPGYARDRYGQDPPYGEPGYKREAGAFGQHKPKPIEVDKRDPYARYPEPYRDPYGERRDPYARDPYRREDPYYDRRPLDDPYRRGYDERYPDPYRALPTLEERPQFKPAETIDYGHKHSSPAADSPKPFQAPAVIDYDHGQVADDHSRQSTPEVRSDMQSSRPPPVTSRAPHLPMKREEKQWDRPAPPPMDRSYPSPYMESVPYGRPTPPPPPGLPPGPPPQKEKAVERSKVEDILCQPGRASRPQQIVIIVRGLPGSGKTYISKLIKDKEVSSGGSAPRMLCLDDYFMIEVDCIQKDPETGRRVKTKVLEYEYEAEMESAYRQNMLKSFKKTIDDGFFPFIIVDAVFDRVKHFEEFWSYAKSKGFQAYVAEMQAEVAVCAKRNTHKRTQREIERLHHKWEATPRHYIQLDVRYLLQEDSITEVEMEDLDGEPMPTEKEEPAPTDDDDDDDGYGHFRKSRWEVDISEDKLDKLDGLQKKPHHVDQSMDEFLQVADEYFAKQIQEPGRKRVRWADLEERKEQSYRRELGFVVGQTQRDWERITDPSFADRQLNRTKYF